MNDEEAIEKLAPTLRMSFNDESYALSARQLLSEDMAADRRRRKAKSRLHCRAAECPAEELDFYKWLRFIRHVLCVQYEL